MPTPLDRAMNSRNLFLGFGAIITAVSVWSIWGGDMFPALTDPRGEPESWTNDEMKRWLRNHKLYVGDNATREELLSMIKASQRAPEA